jgi:hypothetical protein
MHEAHPSIPFNLENRAGLAAEARLVPQWEGGPSRSRSQYPAPRCSVQVQRPGAASRYSVQASKLKGSSGDCGLDS